MRSRQWCRGRTTLQRTEDRFPIAVQVGQPFLTATVCCGGTLHDRVVPPESCAPTWRGRDNENRGGNVERAENRPRMFEDASISVIECHRSEVPPGRAVPQVVHERGEGDQLAVGRQPTHLSFERRHRDVQAGLAGVAAGRRHDVMIAKDDAGVPQTPCKRRDPENSKGAVPQHG